VTCPPPLNWWSRVWRYALVLAISTVSWIEIARWQWDNARWWFWVDLAVGLVCLGILPWRRRFPVRVAAVTNAATLVSWSAGGPATLSLVSLATRRRWREILPVALLGLAAGLVLETRNPVDVQPWEFTLPVLVLVLGVAVGWGMYIGSRRELLATLRDRAETAEADQHARVAQARAAERSRIAREMHDVLAHRISLVTMHAGAMVYREDLDADQLRATARIIQDNSHHAMTELREVLGILREGPGDADPEDPQPSARDLPELILEARRSGMRVVSNEAVDLAAIPDPLGRTLYRVVQEGLTNARKHAADTLVTVSVAGAPAVGVTVQVDNPLRVGEGTRRTPPSGLGLIGLSERAELAGGRLTHTVSPTGEFVLKAWLPWPP
jgi:signal transduction histidine kinase